MEAVKLTRRAGDINNLLLKWEAYWIYTLSPNALNEEFDIHPFL